MSDLSDMQILDGGFYLVRTPAGFNQALAHFMGGLKIQDELLCNAPEEYPAVSVFSYGYYDYVQVNHIHADKLTTNVEAQ